MDWIFYIGMILLAAGFVLAAVEMVMPGFGVPGISAIICLVAGIFCTAGSFVQGVVITLIVLALLGLMLAVILWLLSKGKLHSSLILKEEQRKEQGFISSQDLNYLLGKKGIAFTDLRPSGTGNFEDINFDVVSEGAFISRGAKIKIIRVNGSKLVVKEIG